MMQRTLSVQVSLDYRDRADAEELLSLALGLAPLATAIFAASPLDGLEESSFLSLRAQAWLLTDPARTGSPPACLRPGAGLREYADYALDVPLLFRVRERRYEAPARETFREALGRGHWGDGTALSWVDLWTHLGSIFTDARLKKGLVELRSTDGQRPGEVCAVAAFWVGLLYDSQARSAARGLLAGLTPEEHRALSLAVPQRALASSLAGRPLLELARELVSAAQQGLERQIAAGQEEEAALSLLASTQERLELGLTPAEGLLSAWRGPWEGRQEALVRDLAFPQGS